MTLAEDLEGHAWREARRMTAAVQYRISFPQNAEPDTIAVAERFRLTYPRARLVKALAYGIKTTPEELSAISGVPRPLVVSEVQKAMEKCGFVLKYGRGRDHKVVWIMLADKCACDEVRKAITASWS